MLEHTLAHMAHITRWRTSHAGAHHTLAHITRWRTSHAGAHSGTSHAGAHSGTYDAHLMQACEEQWCCAAAPATSACDRVAITSYIEYNIMNCTFSICRKNDIITLDYPHADADVDSDTDEPQQAPLQVRVRIKDGYINASDMALGNLLDPEIWLLNKNTKHYINFIAKRFGLHPDAMYNTTFIGIKKIIWIHPLLSISFIRWCDPALMNQFCKAMTDLNAKKEFKFKCFIVADTVIRVFGTYAAFAIFCISVYKLITFDGDFISKTA